MDSILFQLRGAVAAEYQYLLAGTKIQRRGIVVLNINEECISVSRLQLFDWQSGKV
jgi:hypothetical protein